MTPDECQTRLEKSGHLLIRYRGQVFFNTTDQAEALKWEKWGARVVPHYTLDEIENRRKNKLRPNFVPGWEVHVSAFLDAPAQSTGARS